MKINKEYLGLFGVVGAILFGLSWLALAVSNMPKADAQSAFGPSEPQVYMEVTIFHGRRYHLFVYKGIDIEVFDVTDVETLD